MILRRIELGNISDVTVINVDVELVQALHSLLPRPVRFVSRTFYWPNGTVFNDVYVIQFENIFVFTQGMDSVRRDPFWNPRAKFIIIIDNLEDYLQNVSDVLLRNHIYNVALVVYPDDRNVLIYTFGNQYDECNRPVLKMLEPRFRCSEAQDRDIDEIFKSELKSKLLGCHVKFVSHNFWPFVSLDGRDAIENYLLRLIREYEGITVELVNLGIIEQFGSRLDNFTFTGMLHEVETCHVEGAIGGYYLTYDRASNLDFIDPYIIDSQRIILPRAKLLDKWSGLFKQFGALAHWAIFASFCIICVTVTLMGIFRKQVRDTGRDILIVWGYFCSNISQQKAKSGIAYRMVLLNILVFVFMISYAAQASLLGATTHPIRDYQPKSPGEVVSNYQLLITPNLFNHLSRYSHFDLTNASTNCNTTLECMTKVMNGDHPLYTIASDIHIRSYVWKFADKNGDTGIHTIREPVGTLLTTMYLRRGSPLLRPLNKLLRRIYYSGLLPWFANRLHFAERFKYKFHARRGKPQSLKGLRGVFMILVFGYCMSAISFLLEYLLYAFMVFYGTAFRQIR
ncbi:uncharacterized protein LOC134674206 [Cydia fagiglandana]|uniref:uncharacterized protein LOC134674206 n=1 Tax=Cydia fagiglandana TaxID=1458189 RepID=UPI002FEE2225